MERRWKEVAVSFPILEQMCIQGWKPQPGVHCIEGLPEGAQLVRSYSDTVHDYGVLVFEHESFEPISANETVPRVMIVHGIER